MRRFNDVARSVGEAMGRHSNKPEPPAGNPDPSGPNCHANGCPLPGAISFDTKGHGPFHCRFHATAGMHDWDKITTKVRRALETGKIRHPSERPAPPPPVTDREAAITAAREALMRYRPCIPSTDWARRLLDRLADGEMLPMASIEMCRRALRIEPEEMRAIVTAGQIPKREASA